MVAEFQPMNSGVVWPVTEISGVFDTSLLLNFGIAQEHLDMGFMSIAATIFFKNYT